MNKFQRLALTLILPMAVASCTKKSETPAETPAETPVAGARVEDRLIKRWMMGLTSRRMNMTEVKATHLGEGPMEVVLTEEAMTWTETADIDSNGTPETVSFLWDDPHKVLYAFTRDPIKLADGTMADKGLMVSQFGEGNIAARLAGSGWYAYVLDRDSTSTGEVTGRLFGCRFDDHGTELECGEGKWERTANEFTLEMQPE